MANTYITFEKLKGSVDALPSESSRFYQLYVDGEGNLKLKQGGQAAQDVYSVSANAIRLYNQDTGTYYRVSVRGTTGAEYLEITEE